MELIRSDLKKLGIKHNKFVSEKSEIVNKNLVNKAINELKKNDYVEEGYLDPPKGEDAKNWKKIKRLIFKSELFGDDTNELYKRMMAHGLILPMTLLIILIKLKEIIVN